MNTTQREITVALFKWNMNKPILPKMKPSLYRSEFEAEYEKYKIDRDTYLLRIDTEFEKYQVVKCEMRNSATKMMDEKYEEVNRVATKQVCDHLQPFLSESIKKLHSTFYSMLKMQEQVLSLHSCNYYSDIAYKLLDVKNEEMMKLNEYIHAGMLYVSDMLDTVFKELIDVVDSLKIKNTDSIKTIENQFKNNLDKYESQPFAFDHTIDCTIQAFGIECTIHVIDIHGNGWVYIKEVQFDMSQVSNDITRMLQLL